ncbi:Sentrin-specific protease 3, variant 2 [Chamberlinius hualienensis]
MAESIKNDEVSEVTVKNVDEVRKLVAEEGREARNLLIWNVPMEGSDDGMTARLRKPPTSPRLLASKSTLMDCARRGSKRSPIMHGRSRIRSASAGRDPKLDFKARYWAFLFENLRRAVDEVYETCQTDENIMECKEVIMVLENYTKDFHSLIEWFNLKREYDSASPPNRPTSLSWEIRRPSSRSNIYSGYHLNKLVLPRSLFHSESESIVSSPNEAPSETSLLLKEFSLESPIITANESEILQPFLPTGVPVNESECDILIKKEPESSDEHIEQKSEVQIEPERSSLNSCFTNGFDVIHESGYEATLETYFEENEKTDDDSEGWETVRVRSKHRLSPPHKYAKNNRIGGRSNSISGFDMYSDKGGATDHQANRSKRSPNKEIQNTSRPMSGSKTFSALSSAAENKKKPASAKSLPSLHIKLPDDEQSYKDKNSCNSKSKVFTKGVKNQNDKVTSEKIVPLNSKNSFKHSAGTTTNSTCVNRNAKSSVISDKKSGISKNASTPVKQNISNAKASRSNDNKKLQLKSTTQDLTVKTSNLSSSEDELLPSRIGDKAHSDTSSTFSCISPLMVECMEMLEPELRQPGRVLQIHEKLSSPSRKRSITESIRRHEEKQAKAQEQREKIMEEKALKWKEISKKLEENRQRKEEVTQQKRIYMERKLQKAEEKRRMQLQMIVRKAHDEEEKVNEIAFINTLEAQNKRIDVLSRIQGHEARLQDIQEERHRRQEEKAAKEAAAEERRRALDAEWQAKLVIMQEKRKLKQSKIEQHQQEREKERIEHAREKARDREERISALMAAHQANVEELQKKIQLKQEESARRHEENIEHIRQKALITSILRISQTDDAPRLVPYETKRLCSLCNVLIGSEVYLLSHLRGKKHQQALKELHQGQDPSREEMDTYNLKHIADAPADKIDPQIAIDKERHKAYKRRSKKLRQRMIARGNEYENSPTSKLDSIETEHRLKIQKSLREINRCFQHAITGQWPVNLVTSLDRTVSETIRLFDAKKLRTDGLKKEQLAFRYFGGIPTLFQILKVINDAKSLNGTVIPSKTIINACLLLELICKSNHDNCIYLLASNRITGLLDMLVHRLNILIPENGSYPLVGTGGSITTSLPGDNLAKALTHLLSGIISCLIEYLDKEDVILDFINVWTQDVISYAVSIGVIDKMSQYLNSVRGPVDNEPLMADFLQQSIILLMGLTKLLSQRHNKVFEKNRLISEDVTQLVATFKITDIVGIVSLLYGMLLHSGALSKGDTPPPEMSQGSLDVTFTALHMLNHFAVLDINTFQAVVGGEGISLEFRHIISYLLWYCSHCPNESLLHEVILSVGYFVVLNQDNQTVIQSGHMPTVLQQLCLLPFPYFGDPNLITVLFPTLIASCYENLENSAILEQEVSCELLAHFIEEKSLAYLSVNSTERNPDKVFHSILSM